MFLFIFIGQAERFALCKTFAKSGAVSGYGRKDLLAEHVDHCAGLDLDGRSVILDVNVVAGMDFFPCVDGVIRKETDILLRDIGGERVHCGGEIGESAALCLGQPGLIVAVSVKDDAAVRRQLSLNDRSHALVKVGLSVAAGIQLLFQLVGKEHQLMRHHRVENDVGT